jgi:hypothetical protein
VNDERLERELKAALLQDDPGPVRRELRMRVAAVPDEVQPRRNFWSGPRLSVVVKSARAIAAVAVIGAVALVVVSLHSTTVAPGSSNSPSTVPASHTPMGSPTATPTGGPTASSVASGPWANLRWSDQLVFPDAVTVDDIVSWDGGLIAAGLIQTGSNQAAAFWRSSDGTSWTRVTTSGTSFADSQISGLLTAPTGLVAWGWAGQPVCTGQGEGTTCDPRPVMIWTSPDGVAWTQVPDVSMFNGATIGKVTLGAQGFVAVGDTGFTSPAIWASTDGTTWQRETLPSATFTDAHFSTVRATATGYVLGGSTGGNPPASGGVQAPSTGVAAAWWSPDGQTWTKATVERSGGLGTSLGSIYVGASGMVAVGSASGGNGATAWTSTDGRTWQPIAPGYAGAPAVSPGVPTLPSFTVVDDGTRLAALGASQSSQSGLGAWLSSDGATWTSLSFSGATGTIPTVGGKAFVVPGGLIVVGSQGSGLPMPLWTVTALP